VERDRLEQPGASDVRLAIQVSQGCCVIEHLQGYAWQGVRAHVALGQPDGQARSLWRELDLMVRLQPGQLGSQYCLAGLLIPGRHLDDLDQHVPVGDGLREACCLLGGEWQHDSPRVQERAEGDAAGGRITIALTQ
jgi:hypothetical protein